MAKVLGFLRRNRGADADAGRERAGPMQMPSPPPPPAPAPPSNGRAGATTTADGPTAVTPASELVADLMPTRRQASQLNLNRYFASAPVGLTAVLKQPSRQELEASKSTSSDTLQTSSAPTPQIGQQPGVPQPPAGDTPPVRPARERRRSMTATEIAQSMQNIDVSQAAMIMMPGRLKQELGQHSFTQQQAMAQLQMLQQAMSGGAGGGGGAAASTPLPVLSPPGSHLPHLSRSIGQLPSLIGVDMNTGAAPALASPVGAAGAGGGSSTSTPGGALGSGVTLAAPRLDRKPSIIREAMKHQQAQQGTSPQLVCPQPRGAAGQGTDSQLRALTAAGGNFNGDLVQLASALAGQGPERNPGGGGRPGGGGAGVERRTSLLLVPPMVGGNGNRGPGGGGGSGGQSPAVGAAGPAPQGTHGSSRRSEPGETFRGRAVAGMPTEGVLGTVRGMGRPLGPAEDSASAAAGGGGGYSMPGGAGYGTGHSSKDLRRNVMANRSGEQQDEEPQHQSQQPYQLLSPGSEVKLPSIGAGAARRGNGDTRDRDGAGRGGGGGGMGATRSGLTAADVAALSEAITSYQNEAARLRAVALRKVDTRIKRAVMERHMGPEDDLISPGLYDNGGSGGGGGGANPLLRSQVTAANSRANLVQPSPQGATRAGRLSQAAGGDLMGRSRPRMQPSQDNGWGGS